MRFRAALAFFSRLPVGSAPLPHSLDGLLGWLPVVGLLIGLLTALLLGLLAHILPATLCGVLGCLFWVCATGGLHLDGVADCGDGLPVETTPERRLEIMKDPCLGTFGALALFAVLFIKISVLSALVETYQTNGNTLAAFWQLGVACTSAAVLARCAFFLALRVPDARPGGLGTAMRSGLLPLHKKTTFALALFFLALHGLQALTLLICLAVTVFFLLQTAKKRLGGVTGDVFGCLIETAECAVLLGCLVAF